MLRLPVLAPTLVAWTLAASAPARADTARHGLTPNLVGGVSL